MRIQTPRGTPKPPATLRTGGQDEPYARLQPVGAMTSLTVARHRYRWDHALLNRLLGVLEWLRPGPTGLNAEAVLRSAERKTGLSEWGDPRFRLALSALEARFNTDQNTAIAPRPMTLRSSKAPTFSGADATGGRLANDDADRRLWLQR